MLRWRLRACPRCQGDIYIDRDIDGWFEQCLQCSCRRELKELWSNKRTGMLKEDWFLQPETSNAE